MKLHVLEDFYNHHLTCMRAMAASHIRGSISHSHFTDNWRHHGIGVLQSYIRENPPAGPEIRLHVWHPALVRPGIAESGNVHDHRFDLVSTVLVGELHETVYRQHQGSLEMDAWSVENARSAGPERLFDGAHAHLERLTVGEHSEIHKAGTTYGLARGVFHRTCVNDLAVTICAMHDKRGQARILTPAGREPVHAFGEEWLKTLDLLRILFAAATALEAVRTESF